MNLTPYELKQLDNLMGYKAGANQKIIEEFVDSGYDCAKVEGWTASKSYSAAASLNKTIETMHKGGIKAISRCGEVFLVKTSAMNK